MKSNPNITQIILIQIANNSTEALTSKNKLKSNRLSTFQPLSSMMLFKDLDKIQKGR
jgi:hypothetical protein